MARSLRSRVLWLVAFSLLSVWLLLALWLHSTVKQHLGTALDQRLAASARMVASMANASAPALSAKPELQAVVNSGLFCQVMNLRGEILARSGGAPSAHFASNQDGFTERSLAGERWRVYTVSQGQVRVATAEPMAVRESLLATFAWALLVGLLLALLGAWLAVRWAVSRGLAPLDAVRKEFESRPVQAASATPSAAGITELVPLVAALDRWADQARQALLRERRLTDDLAHELRTPLAALKTQLQVARLKLPPDAPAMAALAAAENASSRMADNLQQLLALARLDGVPQSCPRPVQEVIDDSLAQLAGHPQRAAVQRDDVPCAGMELASPSLASLALRNLLENALRYTPPGEPVWIRVVADASGLHIHVEDQGPGITANAEALCTRGHRGDRGQTGLGLAIVASVMARSGGQLALENRAGAGLRATLSWPLTGSA
ncbi:MAG TPA: two-component sensor histidine kinase [Alcanivorax sp.]|nr:two-component sensor histidine kinase [Alcanivorax sp.]